jgi:hypothetical protein
MTESKKAVIQTDQLQLSRCAELDRNSHKSGRPQKADRSMNSRFKMRQLLLIHTESVSALVLSEG